MKEAETHFCYRCTAYVTLKPWYV